MTSGEASIKERWELRRLILGGSREKQGELKFAPT
jgi:hypothetical protein